MKNQPAAPKTVADLMAITGLGRDTVRAAIRTGALPGYYVQSNPRKNRGHYVIPADAFEAFCNGTWQPQYRPITPTPIKPLPQPTDFVKQRTG